MGLNVKKKKGSSLPPMDAGTYPALCIGIVDLGEQYSEKFKNYSDKVLVIWEIPSQTVTIDGEEKPRWLSKDYAASLNEKSNLYKTLVSWRGKAFTEAELSEEGEGFDLTSMLGAGCLIQVIVEEKENGPYNQITSVIGMPVGMPGPTSGTEKIAFDMDNWSNEVFEKLPEWIQDRIKKSTQYQKLHTPTNEISFTGEQGVANAESAAAEECPI